MKDVIRVVLVDPHDESRQSLQRLLGSMSSVWIAEVLPSYQIATSRIVEIAPDLCLVALDSAPSQAVELISGLAQALPEAVVLPASASCDSTLILKSIRAGAREFLTLPTEANELLETITRLFRGRGDSPSSTVDCPQIITVTGAAGGVGSTSLAVNLATSLAGCRDFETILLDVGPQALVVLRIGLKSIHFRSPASGIAGKEPLIPADVDRHVALSKGDARNVIVPAIPGRSEHMV